MSAASKIVVLNSVPKFLLYDDFTSPLPVTQVNGSHIDHAGIGGLDNSLAIVRNAVDTESHLFISDGKYSFDGGKAVSAFGDPAFSYQNTTHSRKFGRVTIFKGITIATFADGIIGLFPVGALGTNDLHGFRLASTTLGIREGGAFSNLMVATLSTGVSYDLAIIERAAGAFFLIRGGAFPYFRLLCITAVSDLATSIAGISNKATVFTGTDIIIPLRLYNIAPLASDSFTIQATTDGQGHAEANGGAGQTWLDAASTWTVSGGAVSNTPSVGADVALNGNMETGDPPSNYSPGAGTTLDGVADERTGGTGVQSLAVIRSAGGSANPVSNQTNTVVNGTWYKMSGWNKNIDATNVRLRMLNSEFAALGSSASGTSTSWNNLLVCVARATSTTMQSRVEISATVDGQSGRFDDIKIEAEVLSTLFRNLTISTPNVRHMVKISALTAGTQAGGVVRLDSAATPTQGIIFYFDGAGNIKCEEFTTATTYTALFVAVVKAFTANDSLIIDVNGSAVRVYHETSAGVPTLIGTGTTTVTTGNIHGLFSTYVDNTITDMNTYPIGTEGQWEGLSLIK